MPALLDPVADARCDPHGLLARSLTWFVSAYLSPADLHGARVLDFGCGVGGSTFALARLWPDAEIVGVELNGEQVQTANALRPAGSRVTFLQAPNGLTLPDGLGTFRAIVLSAVYEHLLPDERRTLLPLLWRQLEPGGILFICGTPHRWFPRERHTTGLWGLNYLPDGLSYRLASRFGTLPQHGVWRDYLRAGIRGGSERQMLRDLPHARVLTPHGTDRAGYWLAHTSPRHRSIKRVLAAGFRVTDRLWGTIPSTHVEVAIQKAVRVSR